MKGPPSLQPDGILETALYARDLPAAERFYSEVLGLQLIAGQNGRHVFFRCGGNVLLIFDPTQTAAETVLVKGSAIPQHGASGAGHMAFSVKPDSLPDWREHLQKAGVPIESEISWPQGGFSIYFRDPAGNSIELATASIWPQLSEAALPFLFPMALNIRTATAADAEVVGTLAHQFADYLRSLGDTTDFQLTAETYRRDGFGSRPSFAGLVAELEGAVVGYLLYHPGYDSDKAARNLHVVDLYVNSAWRQQGTGRALMAAAAAIAQAQGARELVWSVFRNNVAAAAFYERLGAQRITDLFWMKLSADGGK